MFRQKKMHTNITKNINLFDEGNKTSIPTKLWLCFKHLAFSMATLQYVYV